MGKSFQDIMTKAILTPATPSDNTAIQEGITEYNIQIIPALPRAEIHKLDFVLKNGQGALLGGINAEYVNWGILFISLLFVEERYRSHGYGSKLLEYVEKLAREKGCYLAHTDTLEFQAKDFYLKHGYEIFGTLNDCPRGYKRYYLKKTLN